MQRHRLALLVAADAVLLWLLHPRAAATLARITALRGWLAHESADRVAVTVAATGLWCVAAWVGLGLLAALVARVPGATGLVAGRLVAVALPAALQRIVVGSAGLGIVLAPVTAAVAAADAPDGPGGRPVATAPQHSASGSPLPGPGWPGSGAGAGRDEGGASPASTPPAEPGPAWPGTTSSTAPAPPKTTPTTTAPTTTTPATRTSPPPAPAAPTRSAPAHRRTPRSAPDRVTVRADDSLWLLGARRLGPHAGDAEVAAYVPALYRANRDVIGDDPNLVRPGQQLTLPSPDPVTRAHGAVP